MNLSDIEFVFLDLQTTGATPSQGNALEMAWCQARAADPTAPAIHSCLLSQPEGKIPRRIQQLTGITEADLTGALEPAQALQQFISTTKASSASACLIHFARFEQVFLAHAFPAILRCFEVLCTHQIAQRLFPNIPSRGLRALSGYFGMSLSDCKRAASHVEATFFVWRHLCEALRAVGCTTTEELVQWLGNTKPQRRTKYEYPLDSQKRLSLPDVPGVYKMMSADGKVLYVGKATSLKDRVNSYFRGRRKKDSFKLEMLTRVWDIRVIECATVLEACLLECEEIKRLSPPYNISLNQADRALLFYSERLDTVAYEQSDNTKLGPFRSEAVMDSLARFLCSMRSDRIDPEIFFDDIAEELLDRGFQIFASRHQLSREKLSSHRTTLALALVLFRRYRHQLEETEGSEDTAPESVEMIKPAREKNRKGSRNAKNAESEQPSVVPEMTPEDVADKFERMLVRSARAYLQSQRLTRLLNADISFSEEEHRTGVLTVSQGSVYSHASMGLKVTSKQYPWQGLTLADFDRMRVLDTELRRLQTSGRSVMVRCKPPESQLCTTAGS